MLATLPTVSRPRTRPVADVRRTLLELAYRLHATKVVARAGVRVRRPLWRPTAPR